MNVKLLTDHHLEFLSLKGGCRGLSESTHVNMPHCLKSHAQAQLQVRKTATIRKTNKLKTSPYMLGSNWFGGARMLHKCSLFTSKFSRYIGKVILYSADF